MNCSFGKQIRYASRKARADTRKRVKGRFVKAGDNYDYDPSSPTTNQWVFFSLKQRMSSSHDDDDIWVILDVVN